VLFTTYYYGDQIKEDEMGGACNTHGRDEKCIQISVRKPVKKKLFERNSSRWKDKIRTGLKETGWEGMEWIHMVLDRYQWRALVNTVMNFWVP
jgi:hypothetical protein